MKSSKKHTKHTALIKPLGGDYHRNEWAIIGAPCGIIHQLVADINELLRSDFKLGYLDAAHQAPKRENDFFTTFTDNIDYQTFNTTPAPQLKQHRKFFNDLDILLVNGNHFKGDKQIVIINEKKKASLSRKLDRLTDIRLVLLEKKDDPIHDYLMDILPSNVPVLLVSDIEGICTLIKNDLQNSIPPLFGLVLAGGKSQRMGKDKGSINYHGKPHREYTADLLNLHCNTVFMSKRVGQAIESSYPELIDTFTGLGPYGAILSAFREHPNYAWLTVACDLPFVDDETIINLVQQRNPSKLATCFHNPETQFPEPLITIWEPRVYPVLLEFLSQGYSCPRKVLINTDIEEIKMQDPIKMTNVNDPDAYQKAKKQLSNQ